MMQRLRPEDRRRVRLSPFGGRDRRPTWTRDATTGLMNARAFAAVGAYALRRAARLGEPAGVICVVLELAELDPDGEADEQALARVAKRLSETTRGEDVLGRTGPSELAVMVLGNTEPETLRVVERLQEALASAPLRHPGVRLGWAHGFATSGNEVHVDELLAAARRRAGGSWEQR